MASRLPYAPGQHAADGSNVHVNGAHSIVYLIIIDTILSAPNAKRFANACEALSVTNCELPIVSRGLRDHNAADYPIRQ